MDFRFEIGLLLTEFGSLNQFFFSRKFASSQNCVLGGAGSEGWFHDLCTVIYAMSVHVLNCIMGFMPEPC